MVDRDTGRVLDFVTVAEPAPPGTSLTFKAGGRETVATACREGRLALGDLLSAGGGCIFSPAQSIQDDVPVANIQALLEVAREMRRSS